MNSQSAQKRERKAQHILNKHQITSCSFLEKSEQQ